MRVTAYELFEVPPRWMFLKLETSDGIVGWGEPIVEGRAPTVRAAVTELLENYLLDRDPSAIERHWQRLYRGGFYRGGPILMSALAGIDQALWDIKGKRAGMPVYELLGGRARDRIQFYISVNTDGRPPDDIAAQAERRVEEGFRAIKLKPTEQVRRIDSPATVRSAVDRLEAVRDAVGDDVDVALDFHGRVAKPMAKRLFAALEPYDPMFYEEPVLPEHNDALAEISQYTTVPIATGERMYSRWDFKHLLASNTVDVIQPDLSHAGGITEVNKIASMAEAYDVAVAPHCPLGPISLAASLQVDACTPNALIQEQVLHRPDYTDRAKYPSDFENLLGYVSNPEVFRYDEGGYVQLPSRPGLGVEIDEDVVRELTVEDSWTFPGWEHEDGSVAER